MNNNQLPAMNKTEGVAENNTTGQSTGVGKKIANKKQSVFKSKNSKSALVAHSRTDSRPRKLNGENGEVVTTLISATLTKQNLEKTYITDDPNSSLMDGEETRIGSRGDSKAAASRDKNSSVKRLPPGVRLYNQSKNPKNKNNMKKKDDGPPKPVLTKNVEEMLIQSNREKCEEIIKTSNPIHETLSESGIDKSSMVDALFADSLFKHVLANLLFHAKILGKNKLETFLHQRVKTFIKEYKTDKQIKENLHSIHTRIKQRIERLKTIRKKYHDDMK